MFIIIWYIRGKLMLLIKYNNKKAYGEYHTGVLSQFDITIRIVKLIDLDFKTPNINSPNLIFQKDLYKVDIKCVN